MNQILLQHITPDEAIKFKQHLVQDGLVQDQDFCWAYHHARYWPDATVPSPRYATFEFADGATATFYQLKWTKVVSQ